MSVHNHGPAEGMGLDCPEYRTDKGLKGHCLLVAEHKVLEELHAVAEEELAKCPQGSVGAVKYGAPLAWPLDAFSEPEPSTITTFEQAVRGTFDEARELLLRKHSDYGPRSIADAPGGPLNGLRVRIFDKVARLNNLVDTGADPKNESLRDTLLDLANYSLIGLLVLDGHWPAS